MPKRRTRKEKIIATLHRKLHNELSVAHTAISTPIKTTIMPSSLYVPLTKSVYFMADLKKSLLLTGIIIALELLLFLIQSRLTR